MAPKFAQLTDDVVFGDLWRRSDLSLRDRSLVTIAALAAMGDDDQLDLYLRLGLDNGLTRVQIAEAFTHLAFYAGWPKATKALAAAAPLLADGAAALPELSIERAGSRPVVSAGPQNFSGQARMQSLFEAQAPSRMSVLR